MACDINVIPDIPVSASIPADTDLVIFTLADGTSVVRTWATIFNAGMAPEAEEYKVAASGGTINNGDTSKLFTNFIGKRLRFFRNGSRQQKTVDASSSYHSFNPGTGLVSWTPAAATDEILIFEPY